MGSSKALNYFWTGLVGDFRAPYTGSTRMARCAMRPFSARRFWAWWTTPSSVALLPALTTLSQRLARMPLEAGAGNSEADINKFLDSMAKDHTHAKAADDLRKGKYTTGWIYCWHGQN